METVQLSIRNAPYAEALRELLERNGTRNVQCVEAPDPAQDGVIVVDCKALQQLPVPLPRPDRVVLITRNDPQRLEEAWNAGIRSVVFSDDPLNMAVLAIMAAELRAARPETKFAAATHTAQRGNVQPVETEPTPRGRRG